MSIKWNWTGKWLDPIRDGAASIGTFVNGVWRSRWFGLVYFSAVTVVLGYWYFHIPAPGKAVAALALFAVVMTFRTAAHGMEKAAFVALMFGFFWIELKAIDEDRRKAEEAISAARHAEQANFKTVLDQERTDHDSMLQRQEYSFDHILQAEQSNFKDTLGTLLKVQKEEHSQFERVLDKEEGLFEHEEQLAESLSGTLSPANGSITVNPCSRFVSIPPGTGLLTFGVEGHQNAAITSFEMLPKTIIEGKVKGQRFPLLSVYRTGSGSMGVLMDLRAQDGKIIARMERDRFVLNRSEFLEAKRDKSSLEIIDEYGRSILDIQYVNPTTVSVTAKAFEFLPMSGVCTGQTMQMLQTTPILIDFDSR
jgi:hypothetical protein